MKRSKVCRSTGSSVSSGNQEEMQGCGTFWDCLPYDVLENILARLPLDSLVRCGRTCKRNYSAVMQRRRESVLDSSTNYTCSSPPPSPSLHDVLPLRPSCKNIPVFCTASDVTTFNYTSNSWRTRSLPQDSYERWMSMGMTQSVMTRVETAGGLMCMSWEGHSKEVGITIWNPITNRYRNLQVPLYLLAHKNLPHTDEDVLLLGIVLKKCSGTYKVVVAGNKDRGSFWRRRLTFDSATESWEASDWDENPLSAVHQTSSVVSWNGSLCFLETGLRASSAHPVMMVICDPWQEPSLKLPTQKPPIRKLPIPRGWSTDSTPCLVVHGDELFCFVRAPRKTRGIKETTWIRYRFLDDDTNGRKSKLPWRKELMMPASAYAELSKVGPHVPPESMSMGCVGQGDRVFFFSTSQSSATGENLVCLDLCDDTWMCLPGGSSDYEMNGDASLLQLRSLEPSLMEVL